MNNLHTCLSSSENKVLLTAEDRILELENMIKRDGKILENMIKRDGKILENMIKRNNKLLESMIKRDDKY